MVDLLGWLDVQATLGFVEADPAPGARRFAGWQGGTRGASDRAIALIEQGIVGNVVFINVAPDIALAPERQRIQFHKLVFIAPLDQRCVGTRRTVAAPHACDPG